jgi:DNA-binding PadR family transcriptional regulator
MKLQQIYQFFSESQLSFLTSELAVCYILSVLLEQDTYASELIQQLEARSQVYRLSDTVLQRALRLLERESMILTYSLSTGRGRPRRMFQLNPDAIVKAQELAKLWQNYLHDEESRALVGRFLSIQEVLPQFASSKNWQAAHSKQP